MSERRRTPRLGFRGRLAASIFLILLVALGATFAAVYRGTGSDLRRRIDDDLTSETAAISQQIQAVAPSGQDAVRARANELVASRTFGPTAQVVAISVPGAGVATSQPELLGFAGQDEEGEDSAAEEGNGVRILSAPPGFADVDVHEAGRVRVLTVPVTEGGRTVATIRAGEPLAPVDRALDGLNGTFLLIGAITLLAGAGAGYALATRTAKPLRSMSRVAGEIDAGEMGLRMDGAGRSDEVAHLAQSFNHMLERLQEAFDRERSFVSDASHELRTPLTIIRGQIEVLAREPDPGKEDVDRTASHITAAIGRMQRLVDDLLLLAATDEGIRLEPGPVVVADLLNLHLEAFSGVADREFRPGEMPPGTVDADPDRLGQVLTNLLSNAVDHTDEGGTIAVSARARGGLLVVDVDDDGPGIPVAERERVFDRLHRTDSSRARRSGGSGLGLAIARALVDAHGGRISAGESPLGGARIEFEIPGYQA